MLLESNFNGNIYLESDIDLLLEKLNTVKEYSFLKKNFIILENAYLFEGRLILSEEEEKEAKIAVEKYIKDSKELLNKINESKNAHRNKSLAFLGINLGLFILGMNVPQIIVLTLIGQFITLFLQFSHQEKEMQDINKMKVIKLKLQKYQSKNNNDKIDEKIETMIEKIDKSFTLFSKKQDF